MKLLNHYLDSPIFCPQAHVQGAMSGPHHSGGHGPQLVMLQPPQQGVAATQHPQHGPQQGQHFYIGHPPGKQHSVKL